MRATVGSWPKNPDQACKTYPTNSTELFTKFLSPYQSGKLLYSVQFSRKELDTAERVQLFATPWTVVGQALLSKGFSRQEYWSGLPFPSPVDLSDPGSEPRSSALQANSLPSEPPHVGEYDPNDSPGERSHASALKQDGL